MAVLIGRFQTRVAAWSLTGLILTALIAALVLLALNESVMGAGGIAAYGILAVAIVVYAWVGRLITVRVAGNAIGWLLLLAGLSLAVSLFGEQYALRGLATSPGSLPAVRPAGAIAWAAALLALTLPIALVLLFPDGRLPSRRWRPVLWGTYVIFAGAAAQLLRAGTAVDGGLTNALQDAGVSYPNPLGVFPQHGWFSLFLAAIFALAVVTAVLAVASVFVRRRGATAERRQQLAWLGGARGPVPRRAAAGIHGRRRRHGLRPGHNTRRHGLQGMSDRLTALGGTLEIASAPGHGTRITGRVATQAR